MTNKSELGLTVQLKNTTIASAIAQVTEALKVEGFGVLTEIDVQATLKKKIDVAEEERKWSDDLALWQARWHMQNWLDCIRTREKPVADVEIGHRGLCLLGGVVRSADRAGESSVDGDDSLDVLVAGLTVEVPGGISGGH